MKAKRNATEADREAIKTYLEEEAAFLAAEREKLKEAYVWRQNVDEAIRQLLNE